MADDDGFISLSAAPKAANFATPKPRRGLIFSPTSISTANEVSASPSPSGKQWTNAALGMEGLTRTEDFVSLASFDPEIKQELDQRKKQRTDPGKSTHNFQTSLEADDGFIALSAATPKTDKKAAAAIATPAPPAPLSSPSSSSSSSSASLSSPLASPSSSSSSSSSSSPNLDWVSSLPRAPWATKVYDHRNFTHRLHEEILDFCAYVSPRPEEHERREALIESLRQITRDLWPESKLEAFGSFATRLYLPISDIDVVLFGAEAVGWKSHLDVLATEIRRRDMASYLEVIATARIPIVKFTDRETGIRVDISFDVEGGPKAAEFINDTQRRMPALRPLTLVLKHFLHCRMLNDTFSGGIGSFMLQMMIISHLQNNECRAHTSHRLSSSTDADVNLGCLLLSFLDLYGKNFNYCNVGFSVRSGGHYYNKSDRGWYNAERPYLLSIENPLDTEHDVGANSWGISRVRKAFAFGYQQLVSPASAPPITNSVLKLYSMKNGHTLMQTLLSRLLTVDTELLEHRPVAFITKPPPTSLTPAEARLEDEAGVDVARIDKGKGKKEKEADDEGELSRKEMKKLKQEKKKLKQEQIKQRNDARKAKKAEAKAAKKAKKLAANHAEYVAGVEEGEEEDEVMEVKEDVVISLVNDQTSSSSASSSSSRKRKATAESVPVTPAPRRTVVVTPKAPATPATPSQLDDVISLSNDEKEDRDVVLIDDNGEEDEEDEQDEEEVEEPSKAVATPSKKNSGNSTPKRQNKKKPKKLFQGNSGTGGKKPNNTIFPSNRSVKRKQRAKIKAKREKRASNK